MEYPVLEWTARSFGLLPQSALAILARRVALPLLFLAASLILAQPCAGGAFFFTGSLNATRVGPTATLLPSGQVLVAGGADAATAELYDPALGTWSATGGPIGFHTGRAATLLPSGKVLMAGGDDSGGNPVASAGLYDSTSGTWKATADLTTARTGHTATLLSNGNVLVAGGYDGSHVLTSAELYDPTLGTWSATGSLNTAGGDTATLLPSGMVLMAGGVDSSGSPLASAELYDPALGTWTMTGSLNTARFSDTATLLPNGLVLVAGGMVKGGESASAELYNPALGTWTATGSLAVARASHMATALSDGTVLVAGGDNSSGILASAEIYDPALGTWSATGSLNTGRAASTATLLPNGMALVVGGGFASAELYDSTIPTPPLGKPLNISTRMNVETGDDVAIAGFIINGGTKSKTVVIRAIGPSLANATPPVMGALADPVLELHKPDGSIATNNNWKDNSPTDQAIIVAHGLDQFNGAPINDLEAVLVASLPPRNPAVTGSGAYTAIVSGSGSGTGIGLVEVYDLDNPADIAELADISTRGLVGTGDNFLIGGVIIGPVGVGSLVTATVVVRAIGPSLSSASPPVPGALADPTLALVDANGILVAANDNWQDTNPTIVAEIQATGLAPVNASESAVFATLVAGNYTALVSGNGATGIGLVEVFHVPTPVSQGAAR